jgi:pimeloyl-ACP methyl ester carboxylesterase
MHGQRDGVVLVHGFLSSAAVWSRFVRLIGEDDDLAGLAVHTFQYASPKVSIHPLRRIPNLNNIADSLRSFLAHDAADLSRLVLVSHSQGGLVVQRFLARMLYDGRGQDLARVRRVVMFACPNSGSEIALLLRRRLTFWHNPQERELRPLDETISDTHRTVVNQIVHATTTAPDRCPIRIVAYAGERDGVVTPASARSVFPDAAVLPGDHFSIVQPDSATHRSYTALKSNLLATLATAGEPEPEERAVTPPPARPPANQYGVIVDKLLAVPRVAEPAFREQVYELLPPAIVHQLRRDSAARLELFGLVRSFDHYPHLAPWDRLLAALTALLPDQPAVADLAGHLARLGLTAPPR